MTRFKDAAEAYDYATTELSKRRGGRSNTPDPDAVHSGGGPKDYAWLDAITVWSRAEVTDPGSGDRPYWFLLWFIPDPLQPRPSWTETEMNILMRAVRDFECLLCEIDYIPTCLHQGRRCKKRKTQQRDAVQREIV
jgi:hypothetical protein